MIFCGIVNGDLSESEPCSAAELESCRFPGPPAEPAPRVVARESGSAAKTSGLACLLPERESRWMLSSAKVAVGRPEQLELDPKPPSPVVVERPAKVEELEENPVLADENPAK